MNSALVVVDMQFYFCARDSVFGTYASLRAAEAAEDYFRRLDVVVPALRAVVDRFRRDGKAVVFTEFGSRDGVLPGWARQFNAMSRERFGAECVPPLADESARVIADLAPREAEPVVWKSSSGPLADSDLVQQLRKRGIDQVVVGGVMTDVCVEGVVRELADSDFAVTVLADATATALGDLAHRACLDKLAAVFARVATTSDVLTAA